MSVNHAYGTPEGAKEKQKRLGKYYSSIDFYIDDNISEEQVFSSQQPTIGHLEIGSLKPELTYSECTRIIETLYDALNAYEKKYKFGMMKKQRRK